MVEYIYLKANDREERDILEDVANTTISCFKKCEFTNDKNNVIASASKFEVLSEGICFELNEPIMDNEMKKRGVAQGYSVENFLKNVKNKPKEMTKFVSISI